MTIASDSLISGGANSAVPRVRNMFCATDRMCWLLSRRPARSSRPNNIRSGLTRTESKKSPATRLPKVLAAISAPSIFGNSFGTGSTAAVGSGTSEWNSEHIGGLMPKLAQASTAGNGANATCRKLVATCRIYRRDTCPTRIRAGRSRSEWSRATPIP